MFDFEGVSGTVAVRSRSHPLFSHPFLLSASGARCTGEEYVILYIIYGLRSLLLVSLHVCGNLIWFLDKQASASYLTLQAKLQGERDDESRRSLMLVLGDGASSGLAH